MLVIPVMRMLVIAVVGDVGDDNDDSDVDDSDDDSDVGDDDTFLNANAEEGLAGYCAKHLSYSPATHIVSIIVRLTMQKTPFYKSKHLCLRSSYN